MSELVAKDCFFFLIGSNVELSTEAMQLKLEKKFGQSPVFVASARMENGGMARNASPACLLKEAIQVISCGYEDKTEWGKEVHHCVQTCSCIHVIDS